MKYLPKWRQQHRNFGQKSKFRPKSKFCVKNEKFDQNKNFGQKSKVRPKPKFCVKNENFGKK